MWVILVRNGAKSQFDQGNVRVILLQKQKEGRAGIEAATVTAPATPGEPPQLASTAFCRQKRRDVERLQIA